MDALYVREYTEDLGYPKRDDALLERCEGDTWLLIENSAGAGATIGRSVAELAVLVDALDGHPRLGVCLDSCHLYASG